MDKKNEAQPEKSVISLEICKKHIKLCEASFFKRRPPVFRLIKKDTPSEDNAISEGLTELFGTHRLTAKNVFLNIPRYLVMARVLHLPSVNDAEIKSMARMEAVKQVPYAADDITMDHRVLRKFKDGYSDVLLIMSQAGMINRFINILKNAGLKAEKVALSSECLFAWYSAIREKSRKKSENNIALVNVDSEYIDMGITRGGELVFTRAFSYTLGEPDAAQKIAGEIRKSITVYQRDNNLKVEKMLISGAGSKIGMIEPVLREDGALAVELLEQAEGIELAEEAGSALDDASFVELIGLSLNAGEARIDLLPEKMKEDTEFRIFRKALTKTLILLGFVLLVFLGLAGQKIFYKYRLLALMDSEIKIIEPRVTEAKRMRGDLKIIKNEIEMRPLAIDVLAEIYRITPNDMAFNLIDYENKKSLALRGTASSLESIIGFITILEGAEYFGNVKLKYTAKRKRRNAEKTDFEITCQLTNVRNRSTNRLTNRVGL